MPVILDTETSQTLRKSYRKTGNPPIVEANVSLNTTSNQYSVQIRLNGATGVAEVAQVLRAIVNKIEADFPA